MEHLRFVSEMDEETFKKVMLTYGQDVWNYAYFLTGKRDLADDISQDVFLSVYRNIGSYRGESSLRTWLFAITRNISRNIKRNAFFRRVILMEWIEGENTATSAETEAMDAYVSNEIWQVVLQLPVKFREVLILDAKYEMTAPEIADLLGISVGTVKSRLSRARKKVSAIWEGLIHETV
ncbi:RNA polymerase sigma factor [Paenibacillus mesotrionivorans]|uniref:RNA polymerase sigma factor n=1 Tax=Paenibacillus mesotrionivorans TaxID=3160968 RepID=A0ACC7NT09_9BACL